MESWRNLEEPLSNFLGQFGKSFQNAYGILGGTLGVFGEILVKVSLLKRASRSHAKTGFFGGSKSIVFIMFSLLFTKSRPSNVPKK